MKAISIKIRRHYDEDSLSTEGETIVLCSKDTTVHFKGVGINWKIPLVEIESLTTKIVDDPYNRFKES
jgi:hypothetical protein